MTEEQITAILAERVLGWVAAPNRFLLANRKWMPRWRFQPFTRLEDAFKLLETSGAEFSLTTSAAGTFTAQVVLGGHNGIASGEPKATAITAAIARAMGLEAPDEAMRAKNQ